MLEVAGVTGSGQGVSTDILEAGASAYVRALSNAVRRQGILAEAEAAAGDVARLSRESVAARPRRQRAGYQPWPSAATSSPWR